MCPLIRTALLSCGILCVSAAAHAQVAVYVTYTPAAFIFFNTANSSSQSGVANGGSAGVTFEHLHEGRFVTAVDVRGSFHSKAHLRGGTGAVDYRVAFVPEKVPLKPFFQLGLGFVTEHDPDVSFSGAAPSRSSAVLDLSLGLDIRLTHSLDLRLLNLEGAAPFRAGVGASLISAGFVYHFTKGTP